jgi:hypothetical protein
MDIKLASKQIVFVILLLTFTSKAQYNIYEPLNINDVEFSFTDFGTMWTFDDIPGEYFMSTYGYVPSEDWLHEVKLSALQFGGGCSAAFVSEDGLIMTNHHCGRGALPGIQLEGEDLLKDGFYAESLEEERRVPNFYVDQLIAIEDVTGRVTEAMAKGETDTEKIDLRDSVTASIVVEYEEESGLKCRIITLYNGGKYSLYAYKRYGDIRLVMAPDFQIAATGWDWDNFTYPRYELDFAFYRAYDEEGKPVKCDNYFTWSEKGAEDGELVFVIGRPGNTDRLISMSELKYFRDVTYPVTQIRYNEIYKVWFEYFKSHPERESELLNKVLGTGNGRKSFAGRMLGLKDEYLMTKRQDFETKFKSKVHSDSGLNSKYGHIWESIDNVINELGSNAREYYSFSTWGWRDHYWLKLAERIVSYAETMRKPEEERDTLYTGNYVNDRINELLPEDIDEELQDLMIKAHANFITKVFGKDYDLAQKVYGGLTNEKALNFVKTNSKIMSNESLKILLESSPEEILKSSDPFIYFVVHTKDELDKISKTQREAGNTLAMLNQQLGRLVFETYGNKIPPDATSSLRISDGVISGYEYNGTIAPGKVTYYGLWDRYNSFDKSTYPWGLHERWKTPPPQLDLSIPIGFASTNDIVGGNSGSSVINKNREIVGLVHDGNLESLSGHFAFLPENNRTVATDSWGLMEALKYIYKTDRLVEELKNSKLSE